MHIELYYCSSELKRLAREEKDSSIAARIRAVYLALEGRDAMQIAAVLGYSCRAVQNWGRFYNRHGLDGLQDKPAAASRPSSIPINFNGSGNASTRGQPLMMGSACFMPPISGVSSQSNLMSAIRCGRYNGF